MKILLLISLIAIAVMATIIFDQFAYAPRLRNEYKRGIMDGAGYYQRHNEFPDYWTWNHRYENENFNLDTIYPAPEYVIHLGLKTGIDTLFVNGKYCCLFENRGTGMVPVFHKIQDTSHYKVPGSWGFPSDNERFANSYEDTVYRNRNKKIKKKNQ